MKSIKHQTLHLPQHAPVMFLSTVMLPNVLLPLFIFEPRYRVMLAHCLEENRMFCIALLKPGISEISSEDDFYETAGLGLLRACVGHPDGTSHLVLQGLARVSLREFVQEKPFCIAKLEQQESLPGEPAEVEELTRELRARCTEMISGSDGDRQQLQEQIAGISDPGLLCDIVAHTFLRSPYRQQQVLEALEEGARLRLLLRELRAEMAE